MSEVRAGDVIAGKFEVERVLGEGGMGYVVAARHLQLGQTVALKFIRPEVFTDEYKKRFLREARNTVRLKSKHVSRVLDVGTLDGGSPYMVMEYLEGSDLSAHLQMHGPLPPEQVCEYMVQACEAIAEAHSHGIIHRDLKPANLFLARGAGGEPVVKVLDFGVSKTLASETDATTPGGRIESVVTKISDLLGSPSYIAPEQIASARSATASSDIWSLGVIMYRLVSGKAPFAGDSLAELIHRILNDPVPNLRDLCPTLPVGLEDIVRRCLDRDGARRPTAVELARLLAPYAGPNAAPSLERIAILGPTLVVAEANARPSRVTGPQSGPSRVAAVDPAARAINVLFWAILLIAFFGGVAIVGLRMYAKRHAPPAPAAAPPAPVVPAAPATISAPSVSAPSVSAPSVSAPSVSAPSQPPPPAVLSTAPPKPVANSKSPPPSKRR